MKNFARFSPSILIAIAALVSAATSMAADSSPPATAAMSPIDLAISPNGTWIVTANQASDSVSLIDVARQAVVDNIMVGDHPGNVTFTPDGTHVLVTATWSGAIHVLKISERSIRQVGIVDVGMHPVGIAVSPDSATAFVGLAASAQVAVIDIGSGKEAARIETGNWPRYITLSDDGNRLAVGCGGDSEIAVIDVDSQSDTFGETLYSEPLSGGINLGQMITSPDGVYAYFPWMIYRTNPINVRNIRLGWVLASRIGRVRLDGPSYREAMSMDVPGLAVADTHDLVISRDGRRLVASSSGTHELLVYRLPDLPFIAQGGPGDLIDPILQHDENRFRRIEVGGRPMGLAMAADDRTVMVANDLRESVQVVDIESGMIINEIHLSPNAADPQTALARAGREIFFDARRSLDQWYSCHSCHQNGGANSRMMDTMNDATEMTFKTVPSLAGVAKTGPWTWHGWQTDLADAMHRSITVTMQGDAPAPADADALIAYLSGLQQPPNPFRRPNGELTQSASRGKAIFQSDVASCIDCHNGPSFTDGEIHDVGTGSKTDHYHGYNTPSLLGTYAKVRWLHHGRAKSLDDVVTDLHSPGKVNGTRELSREEAADLVEYLKSL